MLKIPQISVFFPAFNEEKNIKNTVLEAAGVLDKIALQWEIIIVNDGSSDQTANIIEKLAQENSRIKLISHTQNKGYGAAIKTGLKSCQYNIIAHMDSDGQFSFSEIEKFIPHLKNFDLILGYRKKRIDSVYRRSLQKLLWLVDWALFGLNIKDVDCGLKVFKKKILAKIGSLKTQSAITETEFVVNSIKAGFKYIEVGVDHHPRLDGEQTGGKLPVIFKAAREGLWLWWQMNFSQNNLYQQIIKSKEIIFLILIILAGAFLRTYRLEELMTYLGDEGRDMLIAMDIITGKNFPLIGPPTSVGKLYLGPIYYYFIAPFAWIFKMSPVGPAFFVALIGILSIPLIFLVAKKYFGTTTAYISSLLYTVSPLIVKFSRSSWNPNPMPFFCLLLLLFLYYWQTTKKDKFLYLSAAFYAVMLQLHYMVLLMLPFLVFLVLKDGKKMSRKRSFIFAFLIFIFMMSPVFIFDLKHNFANTNGVIEIFRTRSFSGFNLFDILSRSRDRLRQLFALFFNLHERSWQNDLLVIGSVLFLFSNWLIKKKAYQLIIYGFFIWGILAFGLYRDSVFDHYLGFLFIFPALLIGDLLGYFLNKKNILSIKIFSVLIIVFISLGLLQITLRELNRPPTLNVRMVKEIARLIVNNSSGKPFNFSLLANNNYDDSYRYFFRLWHSPAVYQTEVSHQLFVVCEDLDICQPQGNPKWEIALFDAAYQGKIKLAEEWQPDPVIKVFKFVPQNEN